MTTDLAGKMKPYEHVETFKTYYSNARQVVYDMYGKNTIKGDLMLMKLEKCKTTSQVNNVLAWGRINLL